MRILGFTGKAEVAWPSGKASPSDIWQAETAGSIPAVIIFWFVGPRDLGLRRRRCPFRANTRIDASSLSLRDARALVEALQRVSSESVRGIRQWRLRRRAGPAALLRAHPSAAGLLAKLLVRGSEATNVVEPPVSSPTSSPPALPPARPSCRHREIARRRTTIVVQRRDRALEERTVSCLLMLWEGAETLLQVAVLEALHCQRAKSHRGYRVPLH